MPRRTAIHLLTALAVASAARATAAEPAGRIPVLIVSGANNHDWQWTTPALEAMLEKTGKFDADVTYTPARTLAEPLALARYRALVLDYNGPRWGEAAEAAFLAAVRAGTGVAVVHAANNAFDGWKDYEELVGHCWRQGTGHGAYHAFDVEIVDRDHPVTRDLANLTAHHDELYHKLVEMPGARKRVLATALSAADKGGSGQDEPLITVGSFGQGRVFHTPLGHVWKNAPLTRASLEDPQFQDLLARGVEWAATGDVAPPRTPAQGNWRALFDGVSTAGWRGYGQKDAPAGWIVENGTLIVKGGGGSDLMTADAFGDFELELEFNVSPKANSGILYRVTETADPSYWTGPEFQVIDDLGYFDDPNSPANAPHSAGALYALATPEGKSFRPSGEWNHARIVVRGWQVEHWLNGDRVAALDLASTEGQRRIQASKFKDAPGFAKNARGHIALQDHGDRVAYRNIRIRELPPAPIALFNGVDLQGWTCCLPDGAKLADVWSVQDGVLVCKGQPIGYLRTEADYENFVLDLDWRFSPVTKQAGNSGVLLRMIGADKVWPKSLEAQLQSEQAGDFWVIEEFPARTAKERTNGRNTKRTHTNEAPLGEWNHYRITVDGGHVVLEVNGQVLNEAAEVLETPGKICLQSEGAEIHFRNVSLTPLPKRK